MLRVRFDQGGSTRFVRSFVSHLICMRFTLHVASPHVYRMYCATSMTLSVSRMFVRRESKASKAHSSHKNRWDRFGEQLHLGHQPEPRLVALIYFYLRSTTGVRPDTYPLPCLPLLSLNNYPVIFILSVARITRSIGSRSRHSAYHNDYHHGSITLNVQVRPSGQ